MPKSKKAEKRRASNEAAVGDSNATKQPKKTSEHDVLNPEHDGNQDIVQASPSMEAQPPISLFKSSRFKGYLIMLLASGVNFQAAYVSNKPSFFGEFDVIEGSNVQRNYAMAVALVSVVFSSVICIAHLDGLTPLKAYWSDIFGPASRKEAIVISLLLLWWIVAIWINTGVMGIAGNGKGQYNLYFSYWLVLFVSLWTMERWFVSCGFSSLDQFLASWPNRAPGWIAIFFLSFAALLSILDTFFNWRKVDSKFIKAEYAIIPQEQWEWLMFVTAFTLIPSMTFFGVEIFRETKPGEDKNTKPKWETITEGVILLILLLFWIPSVIVATTPGGAASLVGNAYFFVWATTIFVVDTSVWWIHDWRRKVLTSLQEQEKEYRKIQFEVIQRSKMNCDVHHTLVNVSRDVNKQNDSESIESDSIEGQYISEVAGT